MTDYLKQAKSSLQYAYHAGQDAGPLLAIAEALVALIDRLDMLVDTLISLGAQGKPNCVHGLPADCCTLCIDRRKRGELPTEGSSHGSQ
jgi:hypothetical protein